MATAGSSCSRSEVTGSQCSPPIPRREHPTGLAWARVHPKSNQLWPGDRTHDLCPPDRHNGSRFSAKVVMVPSFLPQWKRYPVPVSGRLPYWCPGVHRLFGGLHSCGLCLRLWYHVCSPAPPHPSCVAPVDHGCSASVLVTRGLILSWGD